MQIEIFIKKVKEMRQAQNRYFRCRTHEALVDAKDKEAFVDQMIRDYESADYLPLFLVE